MKKLFRTARNILFVPRCASCRTLLDPFGANLKSDCMCDSCLAAWNTAKAELCPECSKPAVLCGCLPELKTGDRLAKLVFYRPEKEKVQNNVIYTMKHVDDVRIFEFVADELAVSLCGILSELNICPDECVFTWVPRRGKAIAQNGFDQGRRLADLLAKTCGVKSGAVRLFVRRGGKEQKTLGAKSRIENARKHIRIARRSEGRVKNRNVVIADDLVTTAATVSYAGELLKKAGAARIVYAAVGKSLNKEITKKSRNGDI